MGVQVQGGDDGPVVPVQVQAHVTFQVICSREGEEVNSCDGSREHAWRSNTQHGEHSALKARLDPLTDPEEGSGPRDTLAYTIAKSFLSPSQLLEPGDPVSPGGSDPACFHQNYKELVSGAERGRT